jgi:hypothetical protein
LADPVSGPPVIPDDEPLMLNGKPFIGKGPPPASVRARCSQSFWDRVELLERIADGVEMQDVVTKLGDIEQVGPSIRDRMTALGMLGKYGGLEKLTIDAGLTDDAASLLSLVREARERAAVPYVPPAPLKLAP